ncbi:ATP-binding protein [Pseudomonas cavernae]|uniref:ATP-binding protein n=1 Tax=Pseudomonas cavernae TaxID=2320867 RepID=A0A385Z432_9PSED|nr:ATP-binding protein [Pseudomonas cavernae]AYC33995.1 ATP-binding protein [Pseudomonas cavernae]
MLKRVNIQSLLQAKDSLKEEGFKGFLRHYGIGIKGAEIEDLRSLTKALSDIGCSIGTFDRFYVGYKIPQIGKEFDLLRFGRKCIINIELKNSCSEEKIKKQLIRNKYYLSFIGRKVYAFTFVSESQELHFLRDDDQLEKTKFDHLSELLTNQDIEDTEVPDALFSPSDYLVSPFNSTKKFLAGEYFLTHQQEDVKNQIIDSLKPPKAAKFISIIGSAGTGKTLLTYDIAKHLIESKRKPLIIHCGQLNDGHAELIKNGWAITPIKNYSNHDLANYDLVIIDEAQRIYPSQLDTIIEKARLAKCCCIFSHDKLQTLANWEEKRDVSAKIGSISPITRYKLSEKIRTNKEIAAFIKMLFNNKRSLPISSNGNIEINYFNITEDAKSYLDALDDSKWEILRFTPSQYNKEHHEKYSEASSRTSHQVIGQEFDGVAITIDKFFSYAGNGDLIYKGGAYYDPPKMLFQNITRSRKKLNLVIIDNEELLNRCIAILQ